LAVITEPAKTFSRTFRGDAPDAVDAHIELLTTKQQLLLDDVDSLRARLKESGDEVAALRKEVAVLTDTSPSPHAVQRRMATMLRRAVDEVSEMRAEARADAEAKAEQRKHKKLLADMAARLKAQEAEYAEAKKKLDAELAGMRAEAQQQRQRLLADAKRAVDQTSRRRITILEQLMGVYRDLEVVPAALEAARQERKSLPEVNGVAPAEQEARTA